jgi:hypothetical protein
MPGVCPMPPLLFHAADEPAASHALRRRDILRHIDIFTPLPLIAIIFIEYFIDDIACFQADIIFDG